VKDRETCLREIRERMERRKIFYPDIWVRLLETKTSVLNEIVESNFEDEVEAMGPGKRADLN